MNRVVSMIGVGFVTVAMCLGEREATAQDLVGAKAAVQQYLEKAQQDQSADEGQDTSEFAQAVATFESELANLDAATAATRWLALLDLSRQPTDDSSGQLNEFQYGDSKWSQVLGVLPAPEAWAELQSQILARPLPEDPSELIAARGLRLLAHRLVNNNEAVTAELDALEQAAKGPAAAQPAAANADDVFNKILQGLQFEGGMSGHHQMVTTAVSGLRAILSTDPVAQFVSELDSVDQDWGDHLSVPDLVSLAGRERASELLLRAMRTPKLGLSFGNHPATRQLARTLAIEHVDSLASAPWELCLTKDAGELFRQLVEKFGGTETDRNAFSFGYSGSSYSMATSYYFLGLILRGEDQAATQLVVEKSSDSEYSDGELFTAWSDERLTGDERMRVFAYLLSLAESHPTLEVWDHLTAWGAQVGRSQVVRQLVERLIAQADADESLQRRLKDVLADAMLAAGEVEEAMVQYREILAALGGAEAEDVDAAGQIAARLILVGHLWERPAWVNEGMTTANALFARAPQRHPTGSLSDDYLHPLNVFDIYHDALLRQGELAKLEQLLIDLAAAERASEFSFDGSSTPGVRLAQLYLQAGRHHDVITLLDEAPWWMESDLNETIVTTSSGLISAGAAQHLNSLPLTAARAFAETDNRPLARQIAERLVVAVPGSDAAWQLLYDLAGDDFPEIANRVFLRDQFEERPLIWLARYQLDAGQTEVAEATIRRAISIDPSDGEQGKGDRMRAYAVLADVLSAKGDDQAELFRGAVRAIRMAEKADELIAAGLYTDGIALYNASLEQFADAYCIQSRLAIQLASRGDFEAAAQHYERAFELMPDSFGRVESHCFGCEGAFDGELASEIAERVFTRLQQERPNDPKVHYLTGYLRQSQGQFPAALEHFRQATNLDAEYLNAWVKILELREQVTVTMEQADEASLNAFRLAPLRSAYGSGTSQVSDLQQLWSVVSEVQARIPPVETGPVYRLAAAADAIAAQTSEHFETSFYFYGNADNNPPTPREALRDNTFVGYVTQIMTAAEF